MLYRLVRFELKDSKTWHHSYLSWISYLNSIISSQSPIIVHFLGRSLIFIDGCLGADNMLASRDLPDRISYDIRLIFRDGNTKGVVEVAEALEFICFTVYGYLLALLERTVFGSI